MPVREHPLKTLGAVGTFAAFGAAALYVLRHPKLRRELREAENNRDALRSLRSQLARDSRGVMRRLRGSKSRLQRKADTARFLAKEEATRLRNDAEAMSAHLQAA